MERGPPKSTRPDTLVSYKKLFRSGSLGLFALGRGDPGENPGEALQAAGHAGGRRHRHRQPLRRPGVRPDRPEGRRAAHRRLPAPGNARAAHRSEEHTSELQSLMRISYPVFCLNTKKLKKLTT